MRRKLASFDVSDVRREVLEIGEMKLFFFCALRARVKQTRHKKLRKREEQKEACCVPAHASRTPSHGSGREPMRRYLRGRKKNE